MNEPVNPTLHRELMRSIAGAAEECSPEYSFAIRGMACQAMQIVGLDTTPRFRTEITQRAQRLAGLSIAGAMHGWPEYAPRLVLRQRNSVSYVAIGTAEGEPIGPEIIDPEDLNHAERLYLGRHKAILHSESSAYQLLHRYTLGGLLEKVLTAF